MKIIKWIEWVEVPVEIQGRHHPESGDGWHEPRVAENVEIESVRVCLYDNENKLAGDLKALESSILEKCGEDFSIAGMMEAQEDDHI